MTTKLAFAIGILAVSMSLAVPGTDRAEAQQPFDTQAEAFLKFSETAQTIYLSGAIRMMGTMAEVYLKASPLDHCVNERLGNASLGQWRQIVLNYLRAHPEQWREPLSGLIVVAAIGACRP